MKFCGIFGLILLICIGCQKKENAITEAEFEKTDTLNLPHYPYIDYDAQFANTKLNVFDYTEKYNFVKRFFEDFWNYNQVSGGLLVAKNGKVIYENYRGYANFETKDTLTVDTPIHIASISKVMTALAVMKLVEADKIKLEQLVSNLFPAFPYKDITIRDLLSHRSGLPNYAYFEHDDQKWNTNIVKSNQDVLDALIDKVGVPYSPPNANFSYCNTNYALLALVIEKITGLTYPQAMKYILFDPLKMDQTFVFSLKDSTKVSQSYGSGGTRWEFDYLDEIYGDKNIYSTPRDLFKMDKAMYAKEFLKPKWKKRMKQGYSYEKKGVKNYGLGLRMMEWDTGEKLLYHNGWWHGNYTTYVHGDTDTLTIIALGNKQIRSVYSAFSLAGLLGNYPVMLEMESEKVVHENDSAQIKEDSLLLAMQDVKAKDLEEQKLKEKPTLKTKPEIDSSKKVQKKPKINLDKLDSLKLKLSYNK